MHFNWTNSIVLRFLISSVPLTRQTKADLLSISSNIFQNPTKLLVSNFFIVNPQQVQSFCATIVTLFYNFFYLTNNMPCYIWLERTAETEKNGMKICSYFDENSAILTVNCISRHFAKTEVPNVFIFWTVSECNISFYIAFKRVHYNKRLLITIKMKITCALNNMEKPTDCRWVLRVSIKIYVASLQGLFSESLCMAKLCCRIIVCCFVFKHL